MSASLSTEHSRKFGIDFSIKKVVLRNIQPSPCHLRKPLTNPRVSLVDCYYEEVLERELENTVCGNDSFIRYKDGERAVSEFSNYGEDSTFNTPYRNVKLDAQRGKDARRDADEVLVKEGQDSRSLSVESDFFSINGDRFLNPEVNYDIFEDKMGYRLDNQVKDCSKLIRTDDYLINSTTDNLDNIINDLSLHNNKHIDEIFFFANNSNKYNGMISSITSESRNGFKLLNLNSTLEFPTKGASPYLETPEELFENALEPLYNEGSDEGFWTFDRSKVNHSKYNSPRFTKLNRKLSLKIAKSTSVNSENMDILTLNHPTSPKEQWREDYTIKLPEGKMYMTDSLCIYENFYNNFALMKLANSLRRLSLPIYSHLGHSSSPSHVRPSSENFHLTFSVPATPSLSTREAAHQSKASSLQAAPDKDLKEKDDVILSEEIITQEIVLRISSKDRDGKSKRRSKDPHKDLHFKRTVRLKSSDSNEYLTNECSSIECASPDLNISNSPINANSLLYNYSDNILPEKCICVQNKEFTIICNCARKIEDSFSNSQSLCVPPVPTLNINNSLETHNHHLGTVWKMPDYPEYKMADVNDLMRTIHAAVLSEDSDKTAGIKVTCEVTQIRSPSSEHNFSEQMKKILMIDF